MTTSQRRFIGLIIRKCANAILRRKSISEADFVAADCGQPEADFARRIRADVENVVEPHRVCRRDYGIDAQ